MAPRKSHKRESITSEESGVSSEAEQQQQRKSVASSKKGSISTVRGDSAGSRSRHTASSESEISQPAMVLTSADWFDDHVTCMDSVAKYSTTAPRGMNNPPMNPRVREKLFQDLMEYGVQHTRDWPPPKPRLQEPDHKTSLMSSKCPVRNTMKYHTHAVISLEHQRAGNGATIEKRPAIIRKKWTELHRKTITAGRRRSLSTSTSSCPRLSAASSSSIPDMPMQRAASNQALANNRLAAPGGDSARPSSNSSMAVAFGKTNSGFKDRNEPAEKAFDPPREKVKTEQFVDETQYRTGMDILRSRSRLHAAAVMDRHRFKGDLSAAGSMVLVGAGAAGGPEAGKWQSDASLLTVFHNQAMRTVNPSGLKERKEEPTKRKKKSEEDELQLSDSGLFVARYEMDPNVKLAKTLRQKYPGGEDEEVPHVSAAQMKVMDAAEKLHGLGGLGLGFG